MHSMKKWLVATRARLKNYGWRIFVSVPVSFTLLTFFLIYDRSYLDSALIVLDERFTPLFSGCTLAECNSSTTSTTGSIIPAPVTRPLSPGCNIFDGKWVFDETYPLYNSCRLAEKDFRCHENGRPDRSYQKWRWQPHECSIPRFDAIDMLARLRGLRVVIVGDSMGRTQWESLNCLLLQGVSNKASVQMVHGPITKQKRHLGTRFKDHNVTIDYYRSPFLVDRGHGVPERSPPRVRNTLKLMTMDKALVKNFVGADLLLINTGHWWTPGKTFDAGCYFQVGEKLMLGMGVLDAYRKAMSTITAWVSNHINFNKTDVFFRSFEPAHWKSAMATLPYGNISHPDDYPRARILKEAVGHMRKSAMILNVTSLSSYRPDGHVFNWTGHALLDCAHWCLPGVPDTWNELLYASLLLRGRGVWGAKREQSRV